MARQLRRLLRASGPFRFHDSVARFLMARGERVNLYDGRTFRRAIGDGAGGLFLLEAEAGGEGSGAPVAMTLRAPESLPRGAAGAGERALGHLLAFDLDLAPFYAMAREDPYLAPIAERFEGLKPVRYLGVFEALVTAITTQQVNVGFGAAIRGRMAERWGEPLRLGGEAYFAFPRPEALARAKPEELRRLQFSERKAEYVIGVARAAAEGEIDEDLLRRLPLDEAIGRLSALRGVGRWTSEQGLFRGLGRVEAFPGGDLGVQKVVARYCLGRERAEEKRVRRVAARWAPWGGLAVVYLFAAWRAGVPPARPVRKRPSRSSERRQEARP